MNAKELAEALDWYILNGVRLRQIVQRGVIYDVFVVVCIRGTIWAVITPEGKKQPSLLKIPDNDAYHLMDRFHKEDKEDGL